MAILITDTTETVLPDARVEGERLWLSSSELEAATGWSSRPEGVCRGSVCVPIPPGREREFLRDDQIDAAMLWRHTDLTSADVDVAQLYDGFSFMALAWLEALGLCGPGEGGPFLEGGHRIARTGELPLNTGGGQLSAGRLHGFGHVHEAVRQLWGEGGDRQVGDDPEVAVVGNGGPNAGCLLLTRG